jgi:hypothetical protein
MWRPLRGRCAPGSGKTNACHSEGATRSKSKSKLIKVKGDVPKAKATEESSVQAGKKISFDLTKKNRASLWKRKIFRRPITICQTKKIVVGLLRITNLNIWLVP